VSMAATWIPPAMIPHIVYMLATDGPHCLFLPCLRSHATEVKGRSGRGHFGHPLRGPPNLIAVTPGTASARYATVADYW